MYHDEKSKALLREKDTLTFELYNEHIRYVSDMERRQRTAETDAAANLE